MDSFAAGKLLKKLARFYLCAIDILSSSLGIARDCTPQNPYSQLHQCNVSYIDILFTAIDALGILRYNRATFSGEYSMINEDALYELIGVRLKEMRTMPNMRQLTQEKLATLVGLERTSITNIEAGKQRVPLHVLYDLCDALGVEVSEILPTLSEVSNQPSPEMVTVGGHSYSVSSKIADLVRSTK